MNRIPKDVLSRLEYFHREVDELFHRLFGAEYDSSFGPGEGLPNLDLLETEDELVLRVDLPGIPKDAIDLHVAPNYVVLRGAKEPAKAQRDCLRVERTFGKFQRLVPLPCPADVAKVKARLARGVLEVRVPKLVDRRRGQRRIPIL